MCLVLWLDPSHTDDRLPWLDQFIPSPPHGKEDMASRRGRLPWSTVAAAARRPPFLQVQVSTCYLLLSGGYSFGTCLDC